MPYEHLSQHATRKAGLKGSQAVIGLLVNEKEPFVEQTDTSNNLGPNHHAAAVDDVCAHDARRFLHRPWNLHPVKEPGLFRSIEEYGICPNGGWIVNVADEGTNDAVLKI